MALYNKEVSESKKKNNETVSFADLLNESYETKKVSGFKPKLGIWYQGIIYKISLETTSTKGYKTIIIQFRLDDNDNKDKKHDIRISHVLSGSHGVRAIKDIKMLLSSLKVPNSEIEALRQYNTEVAFVEQLRNYVGTKIKIRVNSERLNNFTILPLEEINNV